MGSTTITLPVITTPTVGYATIADLETYLGSAAPDGSEGMLERASDLMDAVTYNRINLDDEDSGAAWTIAARKAVCAQVAWWIANGEDTGTSGQVVSKSVGRASVSYAQGSASNNGQPELCPITRRVLLSAGLFYRGAWVR